MFSNLAASSIPWYVVRGSGFAALVLLFLVIAGGIGHATGLTYKYIEPVKAWAIHRALGIMLCVALFLHIGAIFFDTYVSFPLKSILVPFVSDYSNGTTLFALHMPKLAIASGIISFYLILILTATSLGWINSKRGLWRKLHYISYVLPILVVVHVIGSGTDLKESIWRLGSYCFLIILTMLTISRATRTSKK